MSALSNASGVLSYRGGGLDLQSADGIKCIYEGQVSAVGDQVVNTTVADYLGDLGGSLLQSCVASQVALDDVDIAAVAQLGCDFLLGLGLVAHQTDDKVV